MVFHYYDDEKSMGLIKAAADVLDMSEHKLLEIFGEYFYHYTSHHGYDKMLNTLGTDFMTFVSNLDFLHSLLSMTYKGLKPPSFVCERGPEGETRVHIYTVRRNMYVTAIAALKAAAKNIFGVVLDIEILLQDKNVTDSSMYTEHTFIQCTVAEGDDVCSVDKRRKRVKQSTLIYNKKEPNILIPRLSLHTAAPYSLIFDRNFKIQSVGVYFAFLCPPLFKKTANIDNFLEVVVDDKTSRRLEIENLLNSTNEDVILRYTEKTNAEDGDDSEEVLLKGRMIPLEENESILFLGNPYFKSLKSFLDNDVFMKSIPLDAFSREVLFMDQQRRADVELSKKIDETTAEVKKMASALEAEKHKTDMLLHEMLPKNVATALKEGQHVEAEKFESATILFTDIVTFTVICSNCEPIQVVDMLNDMFRGFDKLTTEHNLYKVETIGDAYMVVGGVPVVTSDHAQRMVSQGLCMCTLAEKVKSPVSGKAIQIRCGIHTGPVVTGVVGTKMPRFCLFGDSVNTASRMESHGVAGRVHISPSTYREIEETGVYVTTSRGELKIKGKGAMNTYFVDGFAGDDPYGVYKTVCQSNLNLLRGNNSKKFAFLQSKRESRTEDGRSFANKKLESFVDAFRRGRKTSDGNKSLGRKVSLQRVLTAMNTEKATKTSSKQFSNDSELSQVQSSDGTVKQDLSNSEQNVSSPPPAANNASSTEQITSDRIDTTQLQNTPSNHCERTSGIVLMEGEKLHLDEKPDISSKRLSKDEAIPQTKLILNGNLNDGTMTQGIESSETLVMKAPTVAIDTLPRDDVNHDDHKRDTIPLIQIDSVSIGGTITSKVGCDTPSPKFVRNGDNSPKAENISNTGVQEAVSVGEINTFKESNSVKQDTREHVVSEQSSKMVSNDFKGSRSKPTLIQRTSAVDGRNCLKGPSAVCSLL